MKYNTIPREAVIMLYAYNITCMPDEVESDILNYSKCLIPVMQKLCVYLIYLT